ncbi:MAG: hypothetical protein MSD82_13565 [Prevotella sp.]|nr:hypothetical protein [Prevotella sp.]
MNKEEKRHEWLFKGLLLGSLSGITLSLIAHDPLWIILCMAAALVAGAAYDFYISRSRKQ